MKAAVSQDRLFMMNVQTQCCQFFILIKKELMFFTKGCLCSLPRRVRLFTIGKKLCTIGKIKTKKGLCTIPKLKTKTLQMKVFEFHT